MTITQKFSKNREYVFDFSLIYPGLFLLEFSILFGNSSKHPEIPFTTWLFMSISHFSIIILAMLTIKRYTLKRKELKFNYSQLAFVGCATTCFASIAYHVTGYLLSAPSVHWLSAILTFLTYGGFWFPQAIILGNQRSQIFESMSLYEERLIIQARTNIRGTENFAVIEKKIENSIISELKLRCKDLITKINQLRSSDTAIESLNSSLGDLLVGNNLREYSLELEKRGSKSDVQSYARKALRSIRLFARQYRLLYWQSAQNAPIPNKIYILILYIIAFPSMVHYLTFRQFLFSSISLIFGGWIFALAIQKVLRLGRSSAILYSSILIYAIGLIPAILQPIEDHLFPENKEDYPIFVLYIMVPIGYYVLIRVMQLIQPATRDLIESGRLVVSSQVNEAVEGVIEYELEQTLAHSWAIFVHGKILTRLAATALRLEQAKSRGDLGGFNDALDSLEITLQNPELEFHQSQHSLKAELESRLVPWEGLVDIKVIIAEKTLEVTGPRIADVGEVIEEAISNSVRHGKSAHLSVTVNLVDGKDINLTVEDDSNIDIPEYQIRYGLGTKLFNLATDGRWDLRHTSSGSIFEATISLTDGKF